MLSPSILSNFVRFLPLLTLSFLTFISNYSEAQILANDNCSGATFIYLDQSGNTCINDDNLTATSDGIFNACDAAATAPLPPGGNEVWYSYVVTGTVNTITVSPIGANAAQKVSVTVVNGNCAGGGTPNVCNTALTNVDPASVAFTSFAGTQIWFYVTSLEANGEFLVCVSSTNGFINPGIDCNSATALCNTYDFNSPGSSQPGVSVTPSCFNSPPVRPFWYKFNVGFTGPLEFTAFPTNIGGFRWALYNITAGCPGFEVACNSIYDPFQAFGMSSSVVNCTSNPYCPPINVTSGDRYALMIDDTSQSGSGFDFTWGLGVRMTPTADFTVDSVLACGSLTANFTDNSEYNSATVWSFDFGDGTPPISGVGANLNLPNHFYGPGTYLASLTLTELTGCSNSFSRQIVVKPKPTVTFTISDDSLCFDGTNAATADFTANSSDPNIFYDWIFPNNSGSFVTGFGQATAYWNTSGNILVGLQITQNGCVSDTTKDTVHIFNLPTANFALPDSGCTGTNVTVNYTGSAASTATYAWTYGGGTVSNSTNQQFDIKWNSVGTYYLDLAIVENGCLGFPYNDSIKIFQTPTIAINVSSPVCQGETKTFTPLATGAPAGSVYTWNYGSATFLSGTPADGSTGTFVWNTAGNTFMKAEATTQEGCKSNVDSVPIVVRAKPNANFTISDTTVCGGDSTIITYTGLMPIAGNNFTWQFSGALISPGSNPFGPFSLTFPANGVYPITLVTNDNVCNSDTIRDSVIVGSYPISNAGIDLTTCSNQSIAIGTANTAGYTYSWTNSSFLSSGTVSNPQATVPVIGTADTTVRFIVTTSLGFCDKKDTMILTVKAVQRAFFIPPNPQCERNNAFNFSPQFGVVQGATLTWIIGTDTLVSPTVQNYNFSSSGPKSIILQTQTPGCLPDQYIGNVIVKPNPDVNFSVNQNSGCAPLDVVFQNLSPAIPNPTFLWNFGDGIVSFVNNPTHTYSNQGNYIPTLTMTSADTCSTTDTLAGGISAFPIPVALFTAQPLVASELNPVFNFESAFANNGCYFDFGDGTGDSSCSATHTYDDVGTYIVTLYTFNAGGCRDTFQLEVRVTPNYSLYIPNAFTPNNDQINDRLSIYSEGVDEFNIKVYNRRGQIVYESDNTTESWNGKFLNDGEECMAGVYVYEALIKDLNRKKHNIKGQIYLLK
jgi:gliding motility-associated-like protein